jgi:hypothetical protein
MKEKSPIHNVDVDVNILIAEVQKWKQEVLSYQMGMIPLKEHEKFIRNLKEIWAEELLFQNQ